MKLFKKVKNVQNTVTINIRQSAVESILIVLYFQSLMTKKNNRLQQNVKT